MKIIFRHYIDHGEPCGGEEIFRCIEAESLEAAIVEFEDKLKAAHNWRKAAYSAKHPMWHLADFECFGQSFDETHFMRKEYNGHEYQNQPEFFELDEWFTKRCKEDSADLADKYARCLLVPNK